MIKKVIYLAVILAFAFACSQQKGYKIDVKLEGAEGKVLLEKRGAGAMILVDSAEIAKGIAVLQGVVPFPGDYYLSVSGNRGKSLIFVENSKMQVTGHVDSLAKVIVTGSVTHAQYEGLNNQIKKIYDELRNISNQAKEAETAGDTVKVKELSAKIDEIYGQVTKLQEDFVTANPASYVSPYILSSLQYDKTEDELEAMIKALDPKMDSVQSIISLKERIAKLKMVALGQIAPDFVQSDVDGNPVKFSDIYSKNELTLVDFWALWCGSCRRENPNVVTVYNEFKKKGFEVFGVSLDRDKDAWIKAIADDKLTWPHVSDLAYWNNQAAALYAINSIPSSLIVDKTGKIVAKNKRGEELKTSVSELLQVK